MNLPPSWRTNILLRFESKFIREPATGCWIWTAGLMGKGYGQFYISGGNTRLAHRISWELYKGPITAGLSVLHRCDRPRCVNPDHLFLGTPADNAADCKEKGRKPQGETHSNAKLSEADVQAIRGRPGKTHAGLAREYRVTPAHISLIRRGKRWRHLHVPEGATPTPIPLED